LCGDSGKVKTRGGSQIGHIGNVSRPKKQTRMISIVNQTVPAGKDFLGKPCRVTDSFLEKHGINHTIIKDDQIVAATKIFCANILMIPDFALVPWQVLFLGSWWFTVTKTTLASEPFQSLRRRAVTARPPPNGLKTFPIFRTVCELVWSFSAPVGRYSIGLLSPNQF